jgi:drug/metabolite transporter (DMT)-like permease
VRAVFAVLLAAAASGLYALSSSVQALEARRTPPETALRASLIARLVRRPIWIAGALAGLVAWLLQAGALSLGSVGLVQPSLGLGLVVLLVLAVAMLGERVGAREAGGVLAIAAAVTALGWAAPHATGRYTAAGAWVAGIGTVAFAAAPELLRRTGLASGLPTSVAAGLGWAWLGLATSFFDLSLADRHWVDAVSWGLGVVATSWGALLAEMTSLQTWPATRAVPIAFGLEMIVPAVLDPVLAQAAPPHPFAFGVALAVAGAGAFSLGSSPAVARAVAR